MGRPRFTHEHLSKSGAVEATSGFIALPGVAHANTQSPSPAGSIYEIAHRAALEQTRERAFRRYLDRALFSAFN